VCNKQFEAANRQTKTCCRKCAKALKSQSITEWHKNMPREVKREHFKTIIRKTATTRKKNNTPSWNSGKTGVYSKETIEKIRSATLKQMEDQIFKKTKIEKVMEEYLINQNIDYKYSFILEKRQYDFLLKDYKLIIECDGDYWHANPKFFPNPEEWQLKRIKIDKEKNKIAINNGYRIQRFWEDDILNNFENIQSVINDLLATT
jgi:very-short-patch-repair endonuclease